LGAYSHKYEAKKGGEKGKKVLINERVQKNHWGDLWRVRSPYIGGAGTEID